MIKIINSFKKSFLGFFSKNEIRKIAGKKKYLIRKCKYKFVFSKVIF